MSKSYRYDPDNQQQSKVLAKVKQIKQQRQGKKKLRELE